MPPVTDITTMICGAYTNLVTLAPFAATLIIAGTLFTAILTKHVPMGVIIMAVLVALILASLGAFFGAMGVKLGC